MIKMIFEEEGAAEMGDSERLEMDAEGSS